MEFNAAILERVGEPLVVREVTVTELKPHDVLVRNKASGLCHTDLEVIQGQLAYPLPIILGHGADYNTQVAVMAQDIINDGLASAMDKWENLARSGGEISMADRLVHLKMDGNSGAPQHSH